jgi:predicted MFS family arabinose efflux permease
MEGDASRDLNTGLTRSEWLLILVLAAIQFSHSMDFMVMMPLGPKCREELNISPSQFNLMVGSYGFSAALSGLFATWFIDRFDRKTALLSLYTGLTLGTFLCAIAPSYWWLVSARAVAGAFGGIGGSFILVIIGDTFPEMRRGRATGVVMTAFSLASIAGLPAGIMLGNRFGAQSPFGALVGFCLVTLVLAVAILPRMRGHLDRRRSSAAETLAILVQPAHLRAYVFVVMLVMGTFIVAPNFSDYLVHNVGRDKDDLAYVYLSGGLLTFVTLPLIGRLADRHGKRMIFRVMAAGTLAALLVLTNYPESPLWSVLVITTIYWIVSSGRWVPAMAMVTSCALPSYRASFMSVIASLQQMAMFVATQVAGAVIGEGEGGKLTGYPVAGLFAAVSTAVSMVVGGRLRVAEEISRSPAEVQSPDMFVAAETEK